MLEMTGIELVLISDTDMHLFIKKGMRKGIYYVAKMHTKANNKYIKFQAQYKQSKFVVYLDANNYMVGQ